MSDYTLTPLPCWSCARRFPVLTALQDHHLDAHERALHGQPVAVWLARDVTPLATHAMPPVPEAPGGGLIAGSVGDSFWRACQAEGLPYDAAAARHLLAALGIPPEAPADRFVHSLAEAVQRWRDRQTPAPRHAP